MEHDAKRSNRMFYVLNFVSAGVYETNVNAVSECALNNIGHDDCAWLSDAFKSRRDIDTIAVYGAVCLFMDIAKMDANPEPHATLIGHRLVDLRETPLDRLRGMDSPRDSLKNGQHTVAGCVDDTALVRFDIFHEDRSGCIEGFYCRRLVIGHEPRVSDGISRQDCRCSLRDTAIGHGAIPF
jgi:hypothetical protein